MIAESVEKALRPDGGLESVQMVSVTNDPDNFLADIGHKSRLMREGYAAGKAGARPDLRPYGLLFTGMGGSGATANLVKDACTRAMDLPFTIVQHYQIPHHVKPGWHTLALSYSGNTEETLQVTRDALERGVDVTAFTTGGQLGAIADDVVQQPTGYHPRVALAHPWFSVLGFLEGSGILDETVPIDAAAAAVEAVDAACGIDVPEEHNEAKQLARKIVDKIPQIYATPAFLGSALFMRCQLNENAKKIAGVELIPECNHNDLMGWAQDPNSKHFTVVVMSHAEQNPQMQKRIDFMDHWYTEHGIPFHHHTFRPVHTFQDHIIAQAEAVQFADYVSYYVSQLRGIDPSEIRAINALKQHLST